MRLDGEGQARTGPDGAAEQDVVGQQEVRLALGADCGDVRLDEPADLRRAHLRKPACRQVRVPIQDEHRQASVDLRPDDARAGEVELLRVGFLAQHDHLVTEPAPRPSQGTGVDV